MRRHGLQHAREMPAGATGIGMSARVPNDCLASSNAFDSRLPRERPGVPLELTPGRRIWWLATVARIRHGRNVGQIIGNDFQFPGDLQTTRADRASPTSGPANFLWPEFAATADRSTPHPSINSSWPHKALLVFVRFDDGHEECGRQAPRNNSGIDIPTFALFCHDVGMG